MDERLLDKFFNGQCNEEEKRQVMLWYLSGHADNAMASKIESLWNEDPAIHPKWEKASVLQAIHEDIDAGERRKSRKAQPWPQLWNWRYAAAAVLFLLMVGGWWLVERSIPSQKEIVATPAEFVESYTNKGEKRMITLADGTLVKLNADSRLRYAQDYGQGEKRSVFLEGEAFFEVTRDTLRPFQVFTGPVETTVLGTSFNINAYDPKESVTVSVVTGKVQVQQTQAPPSSVYLVPDEQVVFTRTDGGLYKSSFNHQKVLSWKEGTLYFENATFEEIVTLLERWYGVNIDVRRQKIEDGFSGSYTNRSLESVLNGIGFVLHFDYEIQGNQVTIK